MNATDTIEWSPMKPDAHVPISKLRTSPIHVDVSQIKSHEDAHQIICWDSARRTVGWVGIVNIKEVAARYLELLPPEMNTPEVREWAEGVPYVDEGIRQAIADQLSAERSEANGEG